MTDNFYIGLDTESTGLDPAAGHVPIEVGTAWRDDSGSMRMWSSTIWHELGSYTWQEKAFEVNLGEGDGMRASCVEFVLAGLYATDRISRQAKHGRISYET